MSGGSWDYVYHKFDDVADRLAEPQQSALRRALAARIRLIAKALKAIEYSDSGDWSPESEITDIRDALGENSHQLEMAVLIADADKKIAELAAVRDALRAKDALTE